MKKHKQWWLAALFLALLSVGTALADTPLTEKEKAAAKTAMETIKAQIDELKTMGAKEEAAKLETTYKELTQVGFWKEATGLYDTPVLFAGRLLSGEADMAYCLAGAGETIYLTDKFFDYPTYMADDPKIKLQRLEQASIILHENMHLHHGAGEKDAYIEQYRWLRTFSVNSDGSVDWVKQFDGSKGVSPIMDNVIRKLKGLGVSIDDLEKTLISPAIAQNWVGTMVIEASPYYDNLVKDAPPAVRQMMSMAMPTKGKVYPMKVMVERRGTSYAKGKITGVTGESALIDIELSADGELAQKLKVHHLFFAPGQGGKQQEMEYFWIGRTVGDEAGGTWKANFVKGVINNEPIYSGSWVMKRVEK